MRYLIFSDIHFHHTHRFSHPTSNGFTTRELEHFSCADTILRLGKQYNIDKVLFGGDIFGPTGDSMSGQTMSIITRFLWMISNQYPLDIIVGNHDYSASNGDINKLEPFKYMPNITIYDKPTIVDNIVYMPYLLDDEYAQSYLSSVENKQNKVVLSHLEMKDIDLGNGIFTQKGVSINTLKEFKKVFQGHYHAGNKYGKNIYIIGSTQRLSFKDLGKSRNNIIIYDTETDQVIRESFECPDWLTFTDDNIDNVLKADDYNYVKIDVSMDMLITPEIKEKLFKFEGTDIHIDINRIKVNKEVESLIDGDDETEVIRQFVNKSDNSEEQKEALIKEGIDLINRVKA